MFSVLFEAMLFGLTFFVAIGRMGAREHANDLIMKLFRDGILYFLAVSGKSNPLPVMATRTDN